MLQPETADQIQARAWGMYQAGKRQEAAQLCAAALQQVPLHAASLQLLGILALEDRRLSEAIRYLHHTSLLQPDDARVHQALGEAY